LATKTIFSTKLVNVIVVENFLNFPESRRTQISKFVRGRYDQNTELDRDKLEHDETT
jgi:hypothetical protein